MAALTNAVSPRRSIYVTKEQDLFVGIDGGQSGTRCMVIDSHGNILGIGEASKIDFVLAPGGKEKLAITLSQVLESALPSGPRDFCSVFLGLSGVVAGGPLEQAVREVCQSVFTTKDLNIDNDGYIAWAGALECKPGIVMIAGSGSIALGVNHNRKVARAGGWGYLFGDEGGGFGIARDALKMTLHSIDVNQPIESFVSAFEEEFPEIPIQLLSKAFYAGDIDRPRVARVTRKLAVLASQGDRPALELFRSSARMLACKILGTARKLDWPSSTIPWSPVGGVFNSGSVILTPIQEYLELLDGKGEYQMIPPALPPVAGAALLALDIHLGGTGIAPDLVDQLRAEVAARSK